jgi:hypothetical protein
VDIPLNDENAQRDRSLFVSVAIYEDGDQVRVEGKGKTPSTHEEDDEATISERLRLEAVSVNLTKIF